MRLEDLPDEIGYMIEPGEVDEGPEAWSFILAAGIISLAVALGLALGPFLGLLVSRTL